MGLFCLMVAFLILFAIELKFWCLESSPDTVILNSIHNPQPRLRGCLWFPGPRYCEGLTSLRSRGDLTRTTSVVSTGQLISEIWTTLRIDLCVILLRVQHKEDAHYQHKKTTNHKDDSSQDIQMFTLSHRPATTNRGNVLKRKRGQSSSDISILQMVTTRYLLPAFGESLVLPGDHVLFFCVPRRWYLRSARGSPTEALLSRLRAGGPPRIFLLQLVGTFLEMRPL
ncbi:uncharacterized protein LOC125752887 [Canis lupus dingo]|uniref:uncharacterized protein LOC125752887 n=1 Tax=Canis lupus dingo TaxID=286419 RepID=UPI0020C31022|nr:uncharacterized protein LOC125752887 [Canis lupus dingo]